VEKGGEKIGSEQKGGSRDKDWNQYKGQLLGREGYIKQFTKKGKKGGRPGVSGERGLVKEEQTRGGI